jgi:ATP-dependent RNA helicase HelY
MVILCYDEYKGEELEEFNEYPYPLSSFQKHGIKGIVDGNHVLVCASTGSGKTVLGISGMMEALKKGKKVIYTTPIKALSNQKYRELSDKYTDISFGILNYFFNYKMA